MAQHLVPAPSSYLVRALPRWAGNPGSRAAQCPAEASASYLEGARSSAPETGRRRMAASCTRLREAPRRSGLAAASGDSFPHCTLHATIHRALAPRPWPPWARVPTVPGMRPTAPRGGQGANTIAGSAPVSRSVFHTPVRQFVSSSVRPSSSPPTSRRVQRQSVQADHRGLLGDVRIDDHQRLRAAVICRRAVGRFDLLRRRRLGRHVRVRNDDRVESDFGRRVRRR